VDEGTDHEPAGLRLPHTREGILVNANHARPMVAFWLLAMLAALVTVLGLRAAGRPVAEQPQSGAGARATGSSDVVLGSRLHAEPPAPSSPPPNVFTLTPLVVETTAFAVTPATTTSTQASTQGRTVRTAAVAPKVTARTPVTVTAKTVAVSRPTVAAALAPVRAAGKQPHGRGKQTAVASARSMSPSRGRRPGKRDALNRAQNHARAHGQQHLPPARAKGAAHS